MQTMVEHLQELARRMVADFDARTPGRFLEAPLDLSAAQAYDIQAEVARFRERRGESLIGYKVGCTSHAVRAQIGVDEPLFGRLFDTGCHSAAARVSSASFANLAIEGELAVRLSQDLEGASVTAEQCREAIGEVFPVIELHHYVLPKFCPTGPWMIASNGLHAGLVLPFQDSRCTRHAQRARSIEIRKDGVLIGSAEDAESLARPVTSLLWLTCRLASFGLQLHRGQLILTGSPLPLYPVAAGNCIVVDAPPLGSSSVEICS